MAHPLKIKPIGSKKIYRQFKEAQADDNLITLIETLQAIDDTKPVAMLNKTSISDRNGGRILL